MARPDDTGRTALHYSCLEGQAGVVEEMMAKLTKKDVNQPDKEGMTPLMAACFMKQTDIVRWPQHPSSSLCLAFRATPHLSRERNKARSVAVPSAR